MKKFIFSLCLYLFTSTSVFAASNILFRTDTGFSPVKFSVGQTYNNTSLGFGVTFNIQIDYLFESFFSSVGLYYHTVIGSNYGLVPLNEMGISFTYYPYDFVKEKVIIDNSVSLDIKKVIPFISLNAGITSFSVTDTTLETSFNALLLDTTVLAGVMFPYGQKMFFTTTVGYQMSFGGTGSSSGESAIEVPSISFNSVQLLVGLAYNP